MIGAAEVHDAVPVTFDESGELLKGFEPLPFERLSPTQEEASGLFIRPALPQEFELLPEEVGGVEALVRFEEETERFLPRLREAVRIPKEIVPLPLDEAPVGASHPLVLASADIIHCGAQVRQDVELVVDDGGVWSTPLG